MLPEDLRLSKRTRKPPYNWLEQKKKKRRENEREKRENKGFRMVPTLPKGDVKEKSSLNLYRRRQPN